MPILRSTHFPHVPLAWTAFAVAASLLILSACTDTKFTQNPTSESYPPYAGKVRVLTTLPSPGSFDRVGVVVVRGPESVSDERLLRDLLDEAAAKGANAVVLQGKVRSSPYKDGFTQRQLAAFALRLP